MKNHIRLHGQTVSAVTAMFFFGFALSLTGAPTESTQVRKLFSDPPRQYTSAPLWVWNDLLTEEQVRGTMRDLAEQNVKQVFVHPRPGLMTPYLSEDWFRLWKAALDEAERLDMNVWIYDENSYPSGFAGGWVPELMPESRGRGLRFRQSSEQPTWADNVLAVFMRNGNRLEDVTKQVKAGEKLTGQGYIAATIERAQNSPWHGGRCYVDLLFPGVTEKFLEVTMGAYEREIGRQFGKRVPGVFTDEPELQPAGGLPWTDDLPEQFEKRWGYSLIANLASLTQPVGDWRKVRHDYYSTLLRLFIERWGKPYYDYCERRGLEFTGHYWEHEWPNCTMVPDNMAMAAWQQRPGIDILMNQYAENTHAQFGNVRSCREIASVANQLGRGRTLVELYGAGGWDLRFEDMKRIGDWLQVLGVNTLDEHLSYVTIRGARKNDHPQSFSYHEPWWPAYNALAKYFSRLTAALTQGEQINRILVVEPTTTAWMYQGDGAALNRLGSEFFNLLMSLEAAQIEYDLGCEDIMARHGAVREGRLWVGKRGYDVVVLPPGMENVRSEVADLGEEFLTAGGSIVCLGQPPSRIDGRESDRAQQGAGEPGWITAKPEDAVAVLRRWNSEDEFRIRRAEKDGGVLFHMRRKLADGDLVFLVNTSIANPSDGIVESNRKGVEVWDPATGRISPFAFETTGSGVSARYSLPPCGSLVLFFSNKPVKSAPPESGAAIQIAGSGETRARRIGPNVLKLDYVDVTAGGETLSNAYYYAAAQFAFKKNGMPGNPWDSAVQFKDELISKTFPPESGFTATYRFNIECDVPGNLALVVERPDLYKIKCNGVEVSAELDGPSKTAARAYASRQQRRTGSQNQTIGGYTATFKNWWLDKSFGRIPIAHAAKRGENIVTLEARPFSMWHEIEAAFIVGDFRLKPVERGFVIVADAAPEILNTIGLPAHTNNPDGTAWLSGGIGFQKNPDGSAVEDRQPYVVFDLGRATDIRQVRIWNYNEGHVRDLTGRGTKDLRILGSVESLDSFALDLGRFTLPRANQSSPPTVLDLPATRLRFIRFDILSNQNGVTYPANGQPQDNGFVGLAEVQFVTSQGEPVKGVKVARVSGELGSHQRVAAYLVDGSGLGVPRTGWDKQGHPFYAEGVSYSQSFVLEKPVGKYVVSLRDWYGSVAEVRVNGKSAGHIFCAPWECEVTRLLKPGRNEIEVTVIGTLKNTLGPHHGNPPLGSAWPGMFRVGPEQGPPPGLQYHTVSYGLFEPFVLKQMSAADRQ
ncbi:MAG: hypothetical protein GX456_07970 [Verrucomicrobia bacterium]|nr:hypothetical protein [Verrucomicrobiota bacterium]